MNLFKLTTTCALIAMLAAPGAGAATVEGERFDDKASLNSSELQLNGVGLRAVFIIKGYAAGLYLGAKVSTWQQVSALAGPKRVQLRMLRSAGPDDFNKALVAGIRKNASEAELAALSDRIAQLERTISTLGSTVKGDVINLDYVPQRGMTLSVNGQQKGGEIAGADFFNAVLGIFVGDHPIDARLKSGLLGQ